MITIIYSLGPCIFHVCVLVCSCSAVQGTISVVGRDYHAFCMSMFIHVVKFQLIFYVQRSVIFNSFQNFPIVMTYPFIVVLYLHNVSAYSLYIPSSIDV